MEDLELEDESTRCLSFSCYLLPVKDLFPCCDTLSRKNLGRCQGKIYETLSLLFVLLGVIRRYCPSGPAPDNGLKLLSRTNLARHHQTKNRIYIMRVSPINVLSIHPTSEIRRNVQHISCACISISSVLSKLTLLLRPNNSLHTFFPDRMHKVGDVLIRFVLRVPMKRARGLGP